MSIANDKLYCITTRNPMTAKLCQAAGLAMRSNPKDNTQWISLSKQYFKDASTTRDRLIAVGIEAGNIQLNYATS